MSKSCDEPFSRELLGTCLTRATEVRVLLDGMKFFPGKSLGQNFLVDANIRTLILDAGGVGDGDHVLEVGPGLGTLTEGLLERGASVLAVEKDKRLGEWLPQRFASEMDAGRFELWVRDALDVDFAGRSFDAFVSNLPYSVGSRILFDMFRETIQPERIAVTVQREVGDRLVATHGTKDFGILAVCGQAVYDVELVRVVPGSCFHPRPRVDSAIVAFKRKPEGERAVVNDRFRRMVKHCFGQRRKQLGTSLRGLSEPVPDWLDPKRRPESLTIVEWVRLAG